MEVVSLQQVIPPSLEWKADLYSAGGLWLLSLCVWSLRCQNQFCNQTGSPHTDLFPLNNDTLQVDIYKGVRVAYRLAASLAAAT